MRVKVACCLALLILFGNSIPVIAMEKQPSELLESTHRGNCKVESLLRSYSEGYANFEYGIINSLGLVGYGQWENIQNPVTTELTYEVLVQLYPGDPSVGFEYPTYRNVKNYPIWVYRP
jgi:hypothetical protein